MLKNLRQNIVIVIVIISFFVLSLSAATNNAETAQTSKKPKASSTPNKKTPAKPEPAQKKAASTSAVKNKAADKKTKETAAKTSDKNSSKNKEAKGKSTKETAAKDKTSDKNQRTSSKQAESKRSNQKTVDKKADDKKTANSKSNKSDSRASNTAAKNLKTAAPKKGLAPAAKKNATATKSTSNKTNAALSKPKPAVKQSSRETSEADAPPQIIVTDVSARIRSQAKASAPELSRVRLGEILQVAEKTPAWYRVRVPSANGKSSSGWISANSVNDLNSAGRDQLYRQIADRYYKTNGMDFATASELYEFLTRATSDTETASSAEIELKRLLALRSALKTIPTGKAEQAPYREFLKSHEKNVIYSEPAGEWMVSSNLFWDLHKKHQKSPVADLIAWEGAQNPLPGECEGYVNCYLFYARMTSGEYLSLHPTGRKNLEALTNLTNLLEPIVMSLNGNSPYNGPTDVTDRAEFNNLIAELRTIISRLPLVEKEKPLQQLKKIAEGFR